MGMYFWYDIIEMENKKEKRWHKNFSSPKNSDHLLILVSKTPSENKPLTRKWLLWSQLSKPMIPNILT